MNPGDRSYREVSGIQDYILELEAILKTHGLETRLDVNYHTHFGTLLWRKPASDTSEIEENVDAVRTP